MFQQAVYTEGYGFTGAELPELTFSSKNDVPIPGAKSDHPMRTYGERDNDRPGTPIRWVSAEDLSDWANRTDGAVSLPTLLAHLIQATHGPAAQLRFPADEGDSSQQGADAANCLAAIDPLHLLGFG